MTEFKGLTGGLNRQVSGERRATFSGSAGRLVRSEAYLLILKWLSAKLPGGNRRRPAQSKGLANGVSAEPQALI